MTRKRRMSVRHTTRSRRKPPEGAWFHLFSFFIPRSIREPYLGCLREDRVKMAEGGYSRASIEWATVSQLLLLVLWGIRDAIMQILTPFKNDRS